MSRDDDLFNEWAAEALMDGDDRRSWEQSADLDLGLEPGCVSVDDMRRHWSAERAAAMAEYDPRDFRWWNSGRGDYG